jgi:hydroxybutyrate-dimer hydrolase
MGTFKQVLPRRMSWTAFALLLGFSFIAMPCAVPALAGEQLNAGMAGTRSEFPDFLVPGSLTAKHYDGITDDLLTAGLGKTGLQGPEPTVTDPQDASQLRRLAIWTNYRALLDISPAGGYGSLYGPNVENDGTITVGEGKIPGWEYIAVADDGSGRRNVTVMAQIPDRFDPGNACIVTATSSGSRGIYGAIAVGEWGLKQGCAVAYTDKGTGNGLDDLTANLVNRIDGRLVDAQVAGKDSLFTANLTNAERASFNAATPNRFAYKHAHSQQNPERDWGRNTLEAVVFAFHALNDRFGTPSPQGDKRIALDRRNTLVIASGVSNGGGAGVAAAEQDQHNLIDGVAVGEPNLTTPAEERLTIRQGATTFPVFGRALIDYFTYANLYQPCAALDPRAAAAPSGFFLGIPNALGAANRCAALKGNGLLAAGTLAGQAAEALDKLRAYGYLPESDLLHPTMYRFATNAVAVTYANTYGRFGVAENLCGFSFANTSAAGVVIPPNPVLEERIFGRGNGIPPTSGVSVVYNDSDGGPLLDLLGISPSSGLADFSLDGAICHRSLFESRDIVTGFPLSGDLREASDRLHDGLLEVQLSARLKDTPAIVVHGRSDTLVPINHASRAYYGKNQLSAKGATQLRYVEVTNAQHFDAFIDFLPGYNTLYVPLHVYLQRALTAMYDHLKTGIPLPPSQVVRTTPRGAGAPPITPANVPPILADPPASDLIVMDQQTLVIPD